MTNRAQLELRLARLEEDVARLKVARGGNGDTGSPPPWWEQIAGTFVGDPAYEEAMRLGRDYRRSLQLGKTKAKRSKATVDRRTRR